MNKVQITPSLFAADFYNLSDAVKLLEAARVDMIHYDVMDNHFVPNISFGIKTIEDICKRTGIPSDVHLMINLDSREGVDKFIKLPVNHITIHLEATQNYILNILEKIRESGKTAGISIKPGTPVETLSPYIPSVDRILLMSVEPGFSGQQFMPESIERLIKLKKMIGFGTVNIQIDGGIDRSNYIKVAGAGADTLVMGTAFFNDKNPIELVELIHSL
jgi:ribulose-phosphate 3-epimerase